MAVFFVILFLGGAMPQMAMAADSAGLGLDAKQMVVCLADNTSMSDRPASFEGTLQLFSRDASGAWRADSKPWPVLFGVNGLAWGRGLNPPQIGRQKRENDRRNPAGLFKIGPVLGYAAGLPLGAKGWPYHQVTNRDAWIDDPNLSDFSYNHLYTLPSGDPFPEWWNREKMHLGDAAYQWLVVIEHNYNDPKPGAGNEIFFHVRRGLHYRTAGCTTMELTNLERLVRWLEPGSNAMLVELPCADYKRVWKDWNLPSAQKVGLRP